MKKIWILTSLFLCLPLVGCAMGNNNEAEQNLNNPNRTINVKNSAPDQMQHKSAREIAKHLVTLSEDVPGVNDATAVIVGKYALVGIDVDNNLDRSEVASTKYTVAEGLKNDPYGAHAVVLADPDTYTRLKSIARQIRQGHPVTGFLDELAAMVNRVMPEISQQIRKNPEGTGTNDNKLSPKQQKELNDNQMKQSNHKIQENKE